MSIESKAEEFRAEVAEVKLVLKTLTPVVKEAVAELGPEINELAKVIVNEFIRTPILDCLKDEELIKAAALARVQYLADIHYELVQTLHYNDDFAKQLLVAEAGRR